MAIRPVYSKLVLPSRKSLEIIINIKIKIYIKNRKKKKKVGGRGPLIRTCSLIRSNTVYGLAKFSETAIEIFIKVALRRLITFHQLCDMPPHFAQRGI